MKEVKFVFSRALFVALGFIGLESARSESLAPETSVIDVAEDGQSWAIRQPANAAASSSIASAIGGTLLSRKRYPGGADEDDLQVQSALPNPSRGSEQQESAVAAPADSAPTSSD